MSEKIVRISGTKSCKTPSGINYCNTDHSFTVTIEYPTEEVNLEKINSDLAQVESLLSKKMEAAFREWENFATRESLPPDSYREIDGEVYPRVSSILSMDMPNIPDLDKHALVGTHLDQVFKHYIDNGKMVKTDIPLEGKFAEMWDEVFTKAVEWINENVKDFNFGVCDVPVMYKGEYRYSGELDCLGMYKGDEAIIDFKKTKNLNKQMKDKFFMQMAAYATALENKPKIMVIASPYNPPVVSDEIEKYFEMFMAKRKEFKKRYGA